MSPIFDRNLFDQMKCFYEILEVPQTASPKDIKKSYFRLALLHHPDKNLDSNGSQSEIFSLIQEAYEVLSDAQERAWYDSNRQHILRGPIDLSKRGKTLEFLMKEDLIPFFSKSCIKPDNDFYKVYGDLFVKIDNEERLSMQNDEESLPSHTPALYEDWSFGNEGDEFPNPRLAAFYNKFATFSSCKSFKWFDEFRVMDFHDRPSKRQAEKKNRRHRELARKEFNTMVRDLVAYVKNRDPRVKKHLERNAAEAEKRKADMEEQKRLAKIAKAKQVMDYVAPDWATTDDQYLEELEEEELECVVCDLIFKTERQCKAHQKTKEHLERMDILRQEMELDNLDLNDSTNESEQSLDTPLTDFDCKICNSLFKSQMQLDAHNQSKKHRQQLKKAGTKNFKGNVPEIPTDPKRNSFTALPAFESDSLMKTKVDSKVEKIEGDAGNIKCGDPSLKKKRRAAKVADSKLRCNVCKEEFPSKTKLFQHINALGHARA